MASKRRWHPEQVSEGGSVIGELFLKLLTQGINELSEPELLVRETAQNSWDAREKTLKCMTPMSFRVSDLKVAFEVRDELKTFFSDAAEFGSGQSRPGYPTVLRELWKRLCREDSSVLYVRDVGTAGLGGPTNARTVAPSGVIDRYVRFLLNVGQANEDESAGGSYGLGRSVFWRMSSCQTVIVYTRFMEGGSYRSRLIGSSIGGQFDLEGSRYTGRHWWSGYENGRPYEDTDAEGWARRLGFEPYDGVTTGTTVMVIAPSTPGGSRDLATALVKSIEYHLWPKYVSLTGRSPEESMTFQVLHNSEKYVPRDGPELEGSPLGKHVEAFKLGRTGQTLKGPWQFSATLDHDFRGVNLRTIGRLSVVKTMPGIHEPSSAGAGAASDSDPEEDSKDLTSVVEDRFAHLADTVALMRTPELIVGYKRIKNPVPDVVLAGVFKATEAANGYLRRCESATHTEWSPTVPRNGEDGTNVPKRVAKAFEKRFIEKIEDWFPKPGEPTVAPSSNLHFNELSVRFGKLIDHLLPGRGQVRPRPDEPVIPDRRPKARGVVPEVQFDGLEEVDGELVNVWSVNFRHRGPVKVEFEVLLRIDSNQTEKTVIRSGGRPAILSIEGYVGPEFDKDNESKDPNFAESFPVGELDANVPLYGKSFEPQNGTDSDLVVAVLTVKAVFDEGTTPVLMVSIEKAEEVPVQAAEPSKMIAL